MISPCETCGLTPYSLAWPMIQAARRFETRLAVVCLIGLHFLPLSSLLGPGLGLGGAALWVELSHPKKVDLVGKDCRWERRGGSCGAASGW